MSFSSSAKNELSRLDIESNCCCMSEIKAILIFGASIKFDGEKSYIKINTENVSVARRIFNLIKERYGIIVEILIKRNNSSKHMHFYHVLIEGYSSVKNILYSAELLKDERVLDVREMDKIYSFNNECCRKSFIRGVFLVSGSISDPEKTYHMEFVMSSKKLANTYSDVLKHFNLNPRTILRKKKYIVYFKGSEDIVDLLNIIGAHKSLLKLENIRVMKELRNNVNRVVNCETANLGKTVNAAVKQIKSIELIKNTIGLKSLPPNLQTIANLRILYKEATLKELGEMLNPPMGKSGINHRLRKIVNIAEGIKEGKRN